MRIRCSRIGLVNSTRNINLGDIAYDSFQVTCSDTSVPMWTAGVRAAYMYIALARITSDVDPALPALNRSHLCI